MRVPCGQDGAPVEQAIDQRLHLGLQGTELAQEGHQHCLRLLWGDAQARGQMAHDTVELVLAILARVQEEAKPTRVG